MPSAAQDQFPVLLNVYTVKFVRIESQVMGKPKMDDAAAERISKARGKNDDFARRAAIAAQNNKEQRAKKSDSKGGGNGEYPHSSKKGGGGGQSK